MGERAEIAASAHQRFRPYDLQGVDDAGSRTAIPHPLTFAKPAPTPGDQNSHTRAKKREARRSRYPLRGLH